MCQALLRWLILIALLVVMGLVISARRARGEDFGVPGKTTEYECACRVPPGTPILLTASMTYEVNGWRETVVVNRFTIAENPLFADRTFYVSRWSPAAAGVRIRRCSPGSVWPVEGVATNDGRWCVNGGLIGLEF